MGRPRVLTAAFQRAGKRKKVTVDGAEPTRLSDALGSLPSVMFSPRDVELVAGAPSERRRFLDVALALTSRRYLAAFQHYRAALVRRNAALRDAARKGESRRHCPGRRVGACARRAWRAALWAARVAWVERVADDFTRLCASIGERGDGADALCDDLVDSSRGTRRRFDDRSRGASRGFARGTQAGRPAARADACAGRTATTWSLRSTAISCARSGRRASSARRRSHFVCSRPLHFVAPGVLRSSCSMIRSPSSTRDGPRAFSSCSERAESRIRRFSSCPERSTFRVR